MVITSLYLYQISISWHYLPLGVLVPCEYVNFYFVTGLPITQPLGGDFQWLKSGQRGIYLYSPNPSYVNLKEGATTGGAIIKLQAHPFPFFSWFRPPLKSQLDNFACNFPPFSYLAGSYGTDEGESVGGGAGATTRYRRWSGGYWSDTVRAGGGAWSDTIREEREWWPGTEGGARIPCWE